MPVPIFYASKRRIRRKRNENGSAVTPPPITGPVLVAATVAADNSTLTLVFDRAIDISAFDGGTAFVNVPAAHSLFQPDIEIVQVDAVTVRASLDYVDASSGSQTTLTVSEPTGIVAVEGGIAWSGCDALVLPFG